MKRTIALLALVFTVADARADLTIEQKMESATMNGNTTKKMKGDKIRMDMPVGVAGAMSTITDFATGDSIMLKHDKKTAMKVSGAQSKQMMDMVKQQLPASEKADAPKLTPTGKSEKIGAYNAEIYTWSTPTMTATLWVAKDFPNYAKIKGEMEKLQKSALADLGKWMSPELSDLPGMVVKTQMDIGGQKITTTLVSVKEENVDPSVFEVPKDYQEMAPPEFPKRPSPGAK